MPMPCIHTNYSFQTCFLSPLQIYQSSFSSKSPSSSTVHSCLSLQNNLNPLMLSQEVISIPQSSFDNVSQIYLSPISIFKYHHLSTVLFHFPLCWACCVGLLNSHNVLIWTASVCHPWLLGQLRQTRRIVSIIPLWRLCVVVGE